MKENSPGNSESRDVSMSLGCKGPVTHADCPIRLWNHGTNWCIGAGSPCIGCCEPGFPDLVAPFYQKLDDANLPMIGKLPGKER